MCRRLYGISGVSRPSRPHACEPIGFFQIDNGQPTLHNRSTPIPVGPARMQLTDTLSNSKVELTPPVAPDGVVRMYVCGVTPYAESHVGHALQAIVFDVLRRYLDWRKIPVRHVQNFTDID